MQYAPEVHARLAEARDLFAKGEANSALALIDQELALYPTSPIFLNEALQIALKIGASKKALSYARRVYKAEPYDLATMTNLAILEMQHGDLQAAARMLPYVAETMPDNLSIQKWLGHALHETGALEEAAIAYEKAIQQPSQRQELLLPLAFVYRNIKRLPESNNLIEEYLESDPENLLARFSLGQNYLLLGDLPKGFRGYESHWLEKPELVAQLPCPLFRTGQSLEGQHVLIFDEQGFGDCIQFSRFIPAVKKAVGPQGKVDVFIRPKMHQIVSDQYEGCQLVDEYGASKASIAIPMMSLPLALELTLSDIEKNFSAPYLTPKQNRIDKWAATFRDMPDSNGWPKIGLVWQGDPNSPAEQGRSLTFEDVKPFFATNADFYLLQFSSDTEMAARQPLPDNVFDLGNQLDRDGNAFMDTIAVMGLMDVVISSDTSSVHLAGAAGYPTWAMLKYVPEWRWQLDGDKSYWYQNTRLFRQQNRADWSSVIRSVIHALNELG